MNDIPNQIHIIWLGSHLKPAHQERLLQWQAINSMHEVNLWYHPGILDDSAQTNLLAFSTTHQMNLRDVRETHALMNVEVAAWVDQLLHYDLRNYGALSDIYRFYILKAYGGWYFDTDVTPREALPIDWDLPYGFAVNPSEDEGRISYFSPAVLVSSTNSPFIEMCIIILSRLAMEPCVSKINEGILHRHSLYRLLSTHYSTGTVALLAYGRLIINAHSPIIHVFDAKDSQIGHRGAYDRTSLQELGIDLFDVGTEASWIEKTQGVLLEGLEAPGTIDEYYRSPAPQEPIICNEVSAAVALVGAELIPYNLRFEGIKRSCTSLGLFALQDDISSRLDMGGPESPPSLPLT